MQIPLPHLPAGRTKIIVAAVAAAVFLIVLFVAARSLFQRAPTPEEIRLRHLDELVRLIEAYKRQHGAYPQPTARSETREGIRHVWGYEPHKPALASCTVVPDDAGNPDPLPSRCGGDVYDAEGTLVGWKGTLTAESGLNTVEVALRGGRIGAPLSEIARQIPLEPLYAALPELVASGFGEYVYAVRVPDDGARNKGGSEYQIAVTDVDPSSGKMRTHIRGTYFVRSDDRGLLPASLIGPGLLFDSFGNPREGQTTPLHVLLDGQREGEPNPVLGDGEETLAMLTLRRRAERLRREIEEREAVADLAAIRSSVSALADSIGPDADLAALGQQLDALASNLSDSMDGFLARKGDEVREALQLEVDRRDDAAAILRDALAWAVEAEETILFARDEVLRYLDGEGIEDQTRARVGRTIEELRANVPDLGKLFAMEGMTLPHPFPGLVTEGAGQSGDVMISTLTAELLVLFDELALLLTQIQDDLGSAATSMEEIDESLRKLARALRSEYERIGALSDALADQAVAETHRSLFMGNSKDDLVGAILDAAARSGQKGDFSSFLFDPAILDRVILEQSPGIPDIDAHEYAHEAEYQGVPYPLPR